MAIIAEGGTLRAETLRFGTNVLKAPEEPDAVEAADNVIDLMQVLGGGAAAGKAAA